MCPYINFVLSCCLDGICMLCKFELSSFYRFDFHLLPVLLADLTCGVKKHGKDSLTKIL